MLRGEYRGHATARVKREVGTRKLLHGADLDKVSIFAQDRVAWAALVSHVKHRIKLQWVKKGGERKGREVQWSSTNSQRSR